MRRGCDRMGHWTRRAALRFAGAAALTAVGGPYFVRADDAPASYGFTRRDDPLRTDVTDATGAWVATFTDGAFTVPVIGPSRTFAEQSAANAVETTTWVRTLPAPFAGDVDTAWLVQALSDSSPDLFALAMQYLHGMPPITNMAGLQIAGDAIYGPLQPNGKRNEIADFNDYLGISWMFPDRTMQPDALLFHCIDCAGYMRMIWGYRTGLPLAYAPGSAGMPRHSWEIAESGPGVVPVPNTGTQITDLERVSPGDLVFFKGDPGSSHPIDHVGMYLGVDTAGGHRFISSSQVNNGPTLGDLDGVPLLNGKGVYAQAFRSTRRL